MKNKVGIESVIQHITDFGLLLDSEANIIFSDYLSQLEVLYEKRRVLFVAEPFQQHILNDTFRRLSRERVAYETRVERIEYADTQLLLNAWLHICRASRECRQLDYEPLGILHGWCAYHEIDTAELATRVDQFEEQFPPVPKGKSNLSIYGEDVKKFMLKPSVARIIEKIYPGSKDLYSK